MDDAAIVLLARVSAAIHHAGTHGLPIPPEWVQLRTILSDAWRPDLGVNAVPVGYTVLAPGCTALTSAGVSYVNMTDSDITDAEREYAARAYTELVESPVISSTEDDTAWWQVLRK
jgi:hypothetical protein